MKFKNMRFVIKTYTSGKRKRRCCVPPASLIAAWIFVCIVLLVQGATSEDADGTKPLNLTSLDRLRMQLFTNYDKNSHPTYRGEPSNITLGLSVNYIDINEMDGKLTLHSWIRVRWMDDNRSWSFKDYDNITTIHIRPKEVWKPDISLFNSAGEGTYLGDTQVLLTHDGSFLWVPPAVYVAYCSLNLLLWPYDTQTCKLKLGTWTLTDIDPRYYNDAKESLDYNELVQSTEWDVVEGKVKYVREDYYNYVEFTFQLQRRSSMYCAVIFTPASCIILLALSAFWLPPQMGEKILLNGVVIVLIAAFLMYFAQLLPILAENTPLVVLFYSSSLLLLSLSTIIAVVVLYLSTAKHKRRIPSFLKNLLNGPLGSVLFLAHFTLEAEPQSILNNGTKELEEPFYENPDSDTASPSSINANAAPSNRSIQFDWILLATAVDRISFLIYCLIFIILAIVYSV